MKDLRFPSYLAAFALSAMLAVSGCSKSKTQPAAGSPAGQPASGQSAANGNPPPPPPDQSGPPSYQSSQTAYSQQQQQPQQPPPPPPPPPTAVIPAGTLVRVRLDQDLGSKISRPGDSFAASVAAPVVVNGRTIIPLDARASGTVIDAKPLGRFRGGAMLELRLERIRTRWGSYPVYTSTMTQVEKGKGKRLALFAGGGGALGAIIGGIAGGGKGALIGGLAGAGAGTAGSAMTGNREIFLPAETLVTFRLEHSVRVTE